MNTLTTTPLLTKSLENWMVTSPHIFFWVQILYKSTTFVFNIWTLCEKWCYNLTYSRNSANLWFFDENFFFCQLTVLAYAFVDTLTTTPLLTKSLENRMVTSPYIFFWVQILYKSTILVFNTWTLCEKWCSNWLSSRNSANLWFFDENFDFCQ